MGRIRAAPGDQNAIHFTIAGTSSLTSLILSGSAALTLGSAADGDFDRPELHGLAAVTAPRFRYKVDPTPVDDYYGRGTTTEEAKPSCPNGNE